MPEKDPASGHVFIGGKPQVLSADQQSQAKLLVQHCKESHQERPARRGWMATIAGTTYRVQRIPEQLDGTAIYALRCIDDRSRNLVDLGMSPRVAELLNTPTLKDGIVLVTGSTGSGKTTTAATMIAERLRNHGGFAITIEDPIEHLLGGYYPDSGGLCYQVCLDAENDDFAPAIREALRSAPAMVQPMLLIGEVRGNEGAAELIRAGASGYLVVSTIHGASIPDAIRRLIAISQTKEAADMAAAALRLVIHQEITHHRLKTTVLYVNTPGIQSKIRTGKLESLTSDMQYQATQLRLERSLIHPPPQ
ncbi:ATPase, T2SS/T4P/T4SS family [Thiolapillus sp.]|uniref:ATPase, T2SS/T4P/T4SS family n=1 Tax=Thiolapillus sp. TaxID=2017437 RepID=UPI00263B73B1|nr:ATPase, T2SS/T4P/T4SS family [Thiolapillus sp.]